MFLLACLTLVFNPGMEASVHAAAQPSIKDLLITNTTDRVVVYLRAVDCFTKEMEEAILAGIPATFAFTLEVYQERVAWVDKKISFVEVKHTVKYDSVKKVFFVSFSEEGKEAEQFKDFGKAKSAMSDLSGIAVIPLASLQRDRRYYLRAKVSLDKVRLPMHLENIFFFVKLWDFETPWIRQDFVY